MEESSGSVDAFVSELASDVRRAEAERLLALMTTITGEEPRMWGSSIIGFGAYHYRYATGREGDAPAAAFSPRKAATTIYLADGVDAHTEQLAALGAHTTGVGCLYIKKLEAVDLDVLTHIVADSFERVAAPGFGQHQS